MGITIYYGDTSNPPPIKRMLSRAIGYEDPAGNLVYYGKAPTAEQITAALAKEKAKLEKRKPSFWPARVVIAPKVLAKIEKQGVPKNAVYKAPPLFPQPSFSAQPLTKRKFHCKACNILTHLCNRHHPMPQEIKPSRATVVLCYECHALIHTIPNPELATMPWASQKLFIENFLLIKFG